MHESRIVVTAGASAALQLATLALVDPGDEWLLPDPSYPCNRHFVAAAGGRAVVVRADLSRRLEGKRALIVDDVLATGGTAAATGRLIERLGATVCGYAFLLELGVLSGRSRLDSDNVFSLITYP